MRKCNGKAALFIVLVFVLIDIVTPISAEESAFYTQDGLYLEIFGVRNSVGKDFDDSISLLTSSALYDVPDVDAGNGFGISLGAKKKNTAFEFSYQRSTHDTSSSYVGIGDQTGYLNIFDMNAKIDIFAKEQVRPYLLLGFGIPWLTITDSMYDGSYDDETFIGLSGNLGAGLAYYLNPRVCLTGGMTYRWMIFTSVDGVEIEDDLSAGGPCFRLGLAFTF